MITFEINKEGENLEIHSDLDGLKHLRSIISRLIESAEQNGNDHVHLMSEAWGGPNSELSNDQQGLGNELINHVKVICWHDK